MKQYRIYLLRSLAVLLAVSTQLSSCAIPCYTSEFLYDYESEVQVGIDDVVPVTSLYKLKGHLYVQVNRSAADSVTAKQPSSIVTFQFRDVKYQTYHGNLEKKEDQTFYESAPSESSDLNLPFDAFYVDGLFKKLNVNSKEKDWSLNLKKAIVSTFQLPSVEVLKKDKEFGISETSVYGFCRPDYTSSKRDYGLFVTKVYFTNLCESSNVHSLHAEQESPRKGTNLFNKFSGIKKYKLNTRDFSYPVIESIETSESMYNSEFGNNGENRFILTKQYFKLGQKPKETNDLEATECEASVEDRTTIHDLKYQQASSENPYGLLFVSNGRSNFQESHQDMTIQKFHEAVTHLEKNNLNGSLKEMSQHQIINELLMHLRYLNSEEIENIYRKTTTGSSKKDITMRNLFFEMLPVIGTKSSVHFAINLLKKEDIIDNEKIESMLLELPFYVLNYTKELIVEAQGLLNLPESTKVTNNIRNSAILTFSTMFGQFCSKVGHNPQCDSQTINEIVEHFFKEIKENQGNYVKQLVYIEALKNLNVNEAVIYLEKIISKNDVNLRDDLRLRALMSPHLLTKFSFKIDKIFLPVLKNRHEPLELRTAALQMILDHELEQSDYKPFKLHWHMAGESSSQLYNYYYTLLKSYADSVNPHHQKKKSAAQRVLRVTKKPSTKRSWLNTAWMYNYISKSYGYGDELIFRMVGNGKKTLPSMVYAELNSIRSTGLVNELGLWIRLKGVEDILVYHLLNQLNAPVNHVNKEDVNFIVTEPLHLESIIHRQGYACAIIVEGFESSTDSESSLQSISTKLLNINKQMIFYNKLTDRTYVTDLGVPVLLNMHYPLLLSAIGNVDWQKNQLKMDVSFRVVAAGGTNLLVFNPVANKWHGVSRVHSSELQLPIGAEFIYDLQKKSFEFTLQRTDGDGYIGLQTAARTYAGVFSGNNAVPVDLVEVSKDSSQKPILHNYFENLYDHPSIKLEQLGYTIYFHSAEFNPHESLLSYISSDGDANSNDVDNNSFLKKWTQYSLITNYLEYMPAPGNRTLHILAAPNTNHGGSKFSIKVNIKGNEVGNRPLPGYKFNVQTKFILSESAKKEKVYVVDTDVDSSFNGVTTSVKSKFSTFVNGVLTGSPFDVNFVKKFPPLGKDAFAYGWGDETVTSSYSYKRCPSEDSNHCQTFVLNVKEEISDEQKQLAQSDAYPYGQCKEDQKKPEWQGPLYPRTWACFEGAIKLFYTRKVTIKLETKNFFIDLPSTSERFLFRTYAQYLDEVNIRNRLLVDSNQESMTMIVNHRVNKPTKDIELATQSGVYKFKFIPDHDRDIFNIQLDNTHFSKFLQVLYASGFDRSCVANSVSVLTPNNSTVSHQFGDQYDALSEIKSGGKYGVYAKKTSSGLAVKVIIGDAVLEISGSSATINGNPVANLEKGIQYPPNEAIYYFRIWSNQGQITVYSRRLGVYVVYSPVSIALDSPIILKGFVNGLCGDLSSVSNIDYSNEEVDGVKYAKLLGMSAGHLLNSAV